MNDTFFFASPLFAKYKIHKIVWTNFHLCTNRIRLYFFSQISTPTSQQPPFIRQEQQKQNRTYIGFYIILNIYFRWFVVVHMRMRFSFFLASAPIHLFIFAVVPFEMMARCYLHPMAHGFCLFQILYVFQKQILFIYLLADLLFASESLRYKIRGAINDRL